MWCPNQKLRIIFQRLNHWCCFFLPLPNKQVVPFTQKVQYLSKSIDLLSHLIIPWHQLKNQSTFLWESKVSKQKFKEVKQVLSFLFILVSPNREQICYLNPSVCNYTQGSLVIQKDNNNSFIWNIYFASRMMIRAKKGYNFSEHMVLDLMFVVTKFRSDLLPNILLF